MAAKVLAQHYISCQLPYLSRENPYIYMYGFYFFRVTGILTELASESYNKFKNLFMALMHMLKPLKLINTVVVQPVIVRNFVP